MASGSRLINTKNYASIAIFLALLILNYHFGSFHKISTNLEDTILEKPKRELLEKFNNFDIANKLLIYTKGLDELSLQKIKLADEALLKNRSIKPNHTDASFDEYKKEYALFNASKISIKDELEKLKKKILDAEFSYFVDPKDPFELSSSKDETLSLKNNHLATSDGYISIFRLEGLKNQELYDYIHASLSGTEDIKAFSPFFYMIENQKIIKDDSNRTVFLSSLVLILLYIVLLRDIKLLLHTLLTLASSILFALLLGTFVFTKISILAVVFGISISSVAIDYMFHHYVHGRYDQNKGFSKDVFFGMLTTISAFFILSNVPLELIKQFSYFTIFSLAFSYIIFAFVFPHIGFSYHNRYSLRVGMVQLISPKTLTTLLFIAIPILLYNLKFDTNIKNLDAKNSNLDSTKDFFIDHTSKDSKIAFLLKAKDIEELIKNAKELRVSGIDTPLARIITKDEFLEQKKEQKKLKEELTVLAKEQGFRDGYFKNAYNPPEPQEPSRAFLKDLGFELQELNSEILTYTLIPKKDLLRLPKSTYLVDLRVESLFKDRLKDLKSSLLLYGSLSLLFIIGVLFLAYRDHLFTYLSFLLFPFGMILSINLFVELNILHIFMLFIILSISIDYGIYASSTKLDLNTKKAILYSIMTTFAGFGVLISSSTNALFSIGLAASVGIVSILFLLFFLKKA